MRTFHGRTRFLFIENVHFNLFSISLTGGAVLPHYLRTCGVEVTEVWSVRVCNYFLNLKNYKPSFLSSRLLSTFA